jgi:hypothetical protein
METWILISERQLEQGQLIVKYWSDTGCVWAGKHIAKPKFESFDKWFPLPEINKLG